MFELFSDIFACRDNALRRVDARAKLAIAAAMILASLLSEQLLLPALFFSICLFTLLCLRIPARIVILRLAIPLGIVFVLVVLNGFLSGTHPIFFVSVFGHPLQFTVDGLRAGLVMGSHVLGAVSVMLTLSVSTPTHEIFHCLRWLRISRNWVEVALLMYRHTFSLVDQAAELEAAQRVRLGYTGLHRSLTSAGALVGSVLIRSLEQGVHTHEAMQVRGYTGHMPFGPMPRMNNADRALIVVGVLCVFCAYGWLEVR